MFAGARAMVEHWANAAVSMSIVPSCITVEY